MRWTREHLSDVDFDVDFLMLYLQRSIQPDMLPGNETIIKFHFTNLKQNADWWIIVNGHVVDICTLNPGREVDVYFTCTVKCISDIWMGSSRYEKEIERGNLKLVGPRTLTRNVSRWMSACMFAPER